MLIVKHKRYIKKHVIGGAGIFSTVAGFFKRLFTSNAAQSIVWWICHTRKYSV